MIAYFLREPSAQFVCVADVMRYVRIQAHFEVVEGYQAGSLVNPDGVEKLPVSATRGNGGRALAASGDRDLIQIGVAE